MVSRTGDAVTRNGNSELTQPTDMVPDHALTLSIIQRWRLAILKRSVCAEDLIGESQ